VQAEYNGLTLEYGTLPSMQVLKAMRAEHWLHNNPQASPATRARIKRSLRDAFYVDTHDWKEQVLLQAREVLTQTLHGLAAAAPLKNRRYRRAGATF
jgi:hypothetical protein